MTTLSAAIMAHPDREEYVSELSGWLGGGVPVAWDWEGPANNDTEKRWRNGRAAWEMFDPRARWHMVIQDDAIPSADLIPGLEFALDHVPDDAIVSLYIGTKRPAQHQWLRMQRDADQARASWIIAPLLMWGVAIIVPTHTIPEMVEWASRRAGLPYDMRTGRYYHQKLKIPTWHTWPSLVDHRDGSSLVGHGVRGRNAHRFHAGSALDLDFSGPIIRDARVKSRSSPSTRQSLP